MEIEFEIINFSQYIKRTDCRTHWFAFESDTLLHPDFFGITGNEFKVFVWCISVATKIRSNKVRLNVPHTINVLGVSDNDIFQCFDKLEKKRVISTSRNVDVTSTSRKRNGHVTKSRLHNRTEQNITEQDITLLSNSANLLDSDFSNFYFKYPKKVGKQKGEKTFKAQIKTPDDLKNINTALDNYLEHIKKNVTDAKYIKQFDTFMNSWRDWLDPEAGKVNFVPSSQKRLGTDRVGVDWDKELFGNQLT